MKKIILGIILLILIALTAVFLLALSVTTSENKTLQYNSPQSSSFSMVLTGDVMFGRGVGSAISNNPNIF